MAKFLFVVPPLYGHISINLAMGWALSRKGHVVHWFCAKKLANIDVPENGKFVVPDVLDNNPEIEPIIAATKEHHVAVLKSMKVMIEKSSVPLSKLMIPELDKYVKEFKPDVIVSDQLAFAGPIVAYQNDIPYATSWSVPFGILNKNGGLPPKVYQWIYDTYLNHQKESGIDLDELILFSEKVNLVATSKEFMQFETAPPYYQVGSLIKGRKQHGDFDWDKLDASSKPRVLISIGTVQTNFQKSFFQTITEAFGKMPCTFVAVTDPACLDEWPDNFIVQKHIPQLEVLKHMDAVIGHGGQNTTSEALNEGLPLLLIPIAYDAFQVAEQVERLGCGFRLNFYRLKQDELYSKLSELLNNPKYGQQSKFIQQSFADAGGIKKAIELLEGLLRPDAETKVLYF